MTGVQTCALPIYKERSLDSYQSDSLWYSEEIITLHNAQNKRTSIKYKYKHNHKIRVHNFSCFVFNTSLNVTTLFCFLLLLLLLNVPFHCRSIRTHFVNPFSFFWVSKVSFSLCSLTHSLCVCVFLFVFVFLRTSNLLWIELNIFIIYFTLRPYFLLLLHITVLKKSQMSRGPNILLFLWYIAICMCIIVLMMVYNYFSMIMTHVHTIRPP